MSVPRALFFLLLLASGVAAGAQEAAPYLAERWTTEDGLPAHTVTGIAQTADGFLWVSTTGGLARFDGQRFEVYTARRGSPLPSSRFNGLASARGDTLWAVTEQGDLVRRAGGQFSVLGRMPTGGPQAVGVDAGGVPHAHVGGQVAALGVPRASPRPVQGAFARGRRGRLWVRCDADRLCRASGGRLSAIGPSDVEHVVQAAGHVAVLRRAPEGWAVTDEDGRPLGRYPAVGEPRLLDSRGTLWSVDGSELLASPVVGESGGGRTPLPSTGVSTILEDREGILWVGTLDEGLLSVREAPFTVYSRSRGLPSGPAITVTEDASGVLAAMTDGNLWRLTEARATRVPSPNANPYGAITDAAGVRWWAGERLVGTSPDGRWELDEEALQILPAGTARTPEASRLWVRGNRETLLVEPYAAGGPRVVRRVPAPESHSMTLGPDGVLWVPTNRGLVRVAPGGTRTYTTEDGLPTDFVRVVHLADDGAVWIGTYGGGLARLHEGTISTLDERDGLAEDVVSSLFEDARGMFWMGGNRSIHRIRRSEAEAVLDGREPLAQGVAYGRADGLLNPEGSGWPALQARDGTLWFPTFEGVAMVDPERAHRFEGAPLRVHIEGVRVEEGDMRASGAQLAAEERRFSFVFTAPAFRAPDRVQFEYRLDGFDPGWIGPGVAREATYTNVPPGTYTFRVRARSFGGEWSDETTTTVTVAPFFWETVWFRILAALAALGGILAIVWWRVRRLRQRQRELEATVAARTAALAEEKETVAAQAAELRTLDEAKSRLFANVSHEFRTPLQLILGPLADVAEGLHGDVPDDVRDQVRLASRNGRRLLALVEQLLALARSDAGELEVEPVRVDAAAFAARVAEAFGPLAAREGIAFETDLPDARGTFDPVAVETALANLLANAFSFTPAGGTVTLSLMPASGDAPLAFHVRDTGPGLSPEDAARVFDRFFQADDTPTRRGSGTGIGLSLVREIARLHGGQATVESVPGEGATFTLALPPHADAPEADLAPELRTAALLAASGDGASPRGDGAASGDGRHAATPLPPEAPADTPRVLVVDDNADLRALVRRHLDSRYVVDEAASGDAALALARASVPDAIVSDVMMPGLDGLGLVRALREDPETDFVPVLLLTARAAVSDTVDGLGAGADDYLAKPFAPSELRARVDALIDGRRRLRERWQGAASEAEGLPVEVASGASDEQRALVRQLVDAVDARLDDEDLSVDALAEAVGMSRATLYRRLRGALPGSPADLLREVRLARAAALLASGAGSVSEVAYAVGFKGVSHFSARFRERYGATPSAYARAPEAHGSPR